MRRIESYLRNRHAVSGFSPHSQSPQSQNLSPDLNLQREAALHLIRQSPEASGVSRSRWTLSLLREHCEVLKSLRSDSGVWRRLHKWRIAHKRGRLHLHSPDPAYQSKVEAIQTLLEQARQRPSDLRLLYADEVSFYRQPCGGDAWYAQGKDQGKEAFTADLSHCANTRYRITATLDACTGQVVWRGSSKIGVRALCQWLQAVRTFYGESMRLVIAWDNWPIHRHPKVEQVAKDSQIECMYLPTYAPWTNPIEKLWRKMKQQMLVLHKHSSDWQALRDKVTAFLDQFNLPNPEILRYVGLNAGANNRPQTQIKQTN